MRAVRIDVFGGPEVLSLAEVAKPEPGIGEVRVEMAYAGVNFTDIYRREGHYAATSSTYAAPLPLTLGIEGAGIVDAIGEGVSSVQIGTAVAFTRGMGSYAEYAIVPAARLIEIPRGLSLAVAAAALTNGMTAHYLATEFGLRPGSTCLVHAGAGGVGQILIRRAKHLGVRIIATVGSPAKAEIARACGADETVLYRQEPFLDAVMRHTNGAGVDVVFDSVGKDTLAGSLKSLRPRGTCVLYGHTSGRVDCLNTLDLAEAGSVFLTRPHMAHYVATGQEYAMRGNEVFRWIVDHGMPISIHDTYPLEDAARAHAALEARATTGKLLLDVRAKTCSPITELP